MRGIGALQTSLELQLDDLEVCFSTTAVVSHVSDNWIATGDNTLNGTGEAQATDKEHMKQTNTAKVFSEQLIRLQWHLLSHPGTAIEVVPVSGS